MKASLDSSEKAANEIFRYLHCAKCLEEQEVHSRLSVGITSEGLQVWCDRHDLNVGHFRWASAQEKASNERAWAQGDGPPCAVCGAADHDDKEKHS